MVVHRVACVLLLAAALAGCLGSDHTAEANLSPMNDAGGHGEHDADVNGTASAANTTVMEPSDETAENLTMSPPRPEFYVNGTMLGGAGCAIPKSGTAADAAYGGFAEVPAEAVGRAYTAGYNYGLVGTGGSWCHAWLDGMGSVLEESTPGFVPEGAAMFAAWIDMESNGSFWVGIYEEGVTPV